MNSKNPYRPPRGDAENSSINDPDPKPLSLGWQIKRTMVGVVGVLTSAFSALACYKLLTVVDQPPWLFLLVIPWFGIGILMIRTAWRGIQHEIRDNLF